VAQIFHTGWMLFQGPNRVKAVAWPYPLNWFDNPWPIAQSAANSPANYPLVTN